MDKLYKKFLKYDMLPLGNYENNKIIKNHNWYENYYIIKLNILVDNKKLENDFNQVINHIDHKYVSSRKDIIEQSGVNLEELIEVFRNHGFDKELYTSYPLHQQGSNDLHDLFKGTYTEQFFKQFDGLTHRQQYSVSKDGWDLSIHRDHENFIDHGFRLMTPINNSSYFGFLDNNYNEIFFKLNVGEVYFVNVTKFHRAFSFNGTRILLRWQSNNDNNIVGEPLLPTSSAEIPKQFIPYKFDRKFWGVDQ
jgi:hypothetical protein